MGAAILAGRARKEIRVANLNARVTTLIHVGVALPSLSVRQLFTMRRLAPGLHPGGKPSEREKKRTKEKMLTVSQPTSRDGPTCAEPPGCIKTGLVVGGAWVGAAVGGGLVGGGGVAGAVVEAGVVLSPPPTSWAAAHRKQTAKSAHIASCHFQSKAREKVGKSFLLPRRAPCRFGTRLTSRRRA